MKKSIISLLFAACHGWAAITLTEPEPGAGFYQGQFDDFAGPVSSAQLPEEFGVAGRKLYGTVVANGSLDFSARAFLTAGGGITGTLDLDTVLRVNYHFKVTTDAEFVPWYVNALVGTSNGGYYGEAQGFASSGQEISGFFLLQLESLEPTTIPAGSLLEAWELYLSVGYYGSPGPPVGITLEIPENTLEILAVGETSEVPEGSTRGFVLRGLLLAAALGRFVRAKSC